MIMIDGRKLSGDISGNIDLNRININNIERIEIVKGAMSSLYGSDAIGGVINIITKNTTDKTNVIIGGYTSANSEYNINNTLNFSNKFLNSSTSMSRSYTDGYQLSNKKISKGKLYDTDKKTVDRSFTNNFSQRFDFNISKRLSAYTNITVYDKLKYKPRSEYNYDLKYETQNYSLGGEYKLNETDYLKLDANQNHLNYYYKDFYDKKTKLFEGRSSKKR